MPKRAALYIRVSSDEQARHGLSLGEQRADLLNYAKEHGYLVMGIYADEGVTARRALSKRKELQRLLADVRANAVDIILVKCLDRWSRNVRDYYKIQEILEAHHVDMDFTQEDYDTFTDRGSLILNIKLSIAQHESDQTSSRIRYVFEGKRKRKELLSGNLPVGMKCVGKHAVPDENMKVVEFLFRHIDSGGAIRPAVALVHEKFGLKLTYNQIKQTLMNRTYIGEMYGIPDYLPATIPHDIFFRVQDILSRNAKPTRSGRIYLFTGLILCPGCGRIMGGSKGAANAQGEYKAFQYRCYRRLRNGSYGCDFGRSIFEPKLERYLLDNLQQMVRAHIVTLEERRARQCKEQPEAKIKSLQAKLSRLEDVYIEGMMDKEKYTASYKQINQEIAELTARIDRSLIVPATLQEIADSQNFRKTYDSLTRESKQHFWKSIIKSITFDPTPDTRGPGAVIPFHVVFL